VAGGYTYPQNPHSTFWGCASLHGRFSGEIFTSLSWFLHSSALWEPGNPRIIPSGVPLVRSLPAPPAKVLPGLCARGVDAVQAAGLAICACPQLPRPVRQGAFATRLACVRSSCLRFCGFLCALDCPASLLPSAFPNASLGQVWFVGLTSLCPLVSACPVFYVVPPGWLGLKASGLVAVVVLQRTVAAQLAAVYRNLQLLSPSTPSVNKDRSNHEPHHFQLLGKKYLRSLEMLEIASSLGYIEQFHSRNKSKYWEEEEETGWVIIPSSMPRQINVAFR